jgi:hypothetical protein
MAAASRKGTGPNCWLAVQLCNNPEFRAYFGIGSTDEAAAYIRRVCHVDSRAELDRDPQAADRFHALVRRPFAYRRAA